MLMLPEVRRAAILLEQIPAAERDHIMLVAKNDYDASNPTFHETSLLDVDQLATTVRFKDVDLPLDAVQSVWRN